MRRLNKVTAASVHVLDYRYDGWERQAGVNDLWRRLPPSWVTSFCTSSLVGFLVGWELMWTGLGWLWPSSGTPYTDWREWGERRVVFIAFHDDAIVFVLIILDQGIYIFSLTTLASCAAATISWVDSFYTDTQTLVLSPLLVFLCCVKIHFHYLIF